MGEAYVVQGVEGEKKGQRVQVFCKNHVGRYITAIRLHYDAETSSCQDDAVPYAMKVTNLSDVGTN